MTLAATLCAIAIVGLLYAAGRRIFGTDRWAIVTAGVFASTPLLWSQVRSAPASLYSLLVVAAWMVAAARLGDGLWWAAPAGALLGLGVYTSTAAVAMIPVYLLLTLVVFPHPRALALPCRGGRVAAFAVPVAP